MPAPTTRRTRIKFCGLTRLQDAQLASQLGVDALGFVMVPTSPRHIAPAAAAKIRRALPPFVSVVALFKDADAATVQEAIDVLRPDLLQFHGRETPGYCESFAWPYLKAVGMGGTVNLARVARDYASASALLLDSHAEDGMGGTGRTFDWDRVRPVKKPLVLAGGLDAGNVAAAVRRLRPHAVDVSSGIERKPGIKDATRMAAFVAAVRRADAK